jgi:hypothetical protein
MSFFIRKGGDGAKGYSAGGRKRKANHSDKHSKAKKRA